ncbi:MAG: NAD(P)-binding domain-containing protein, partial [Parvibaculaceae bacterium]
LYQIATRKVGARDRALTSLFYVSLVGALAAAPATAFMKVEPAAWQWGLLAVMGVLGAIGHYMLTQAHRLAAAPVLAPYVYTQILWMILIGYLVFGNLPDGLTLVGGAVVIASGLYVFYREQGFEGGKADMTKPQIAVLGVGIMGYQQARRLLEAGYPVTGWNRSREKAERLLGHGGKVADSAAEAVRDADIALVMLSDGPTSDKVLDDGVLDAMRRGSLVLVMSSIPVETAQGQARRAAERGLRYVDAPVSGGEKGATEGTLAIMAGGDRKDFEKILPVLQAMGRATLVGLAGAGSLAKLCNQLIVGNTLSTVAEALLLARQGGADPEAVIRALSGGFADSPILQHHGRRMLAGNFAPGGRSSLQLKDLRTAKALAAKVGLELPVMGRVTELYEELVEKRGGADKDQSAVYLEIARRNGLKV